MFEGIIKLFKKIGRKEHEEISSKETAKERLHLVLMQDRANVSADFLEMMKQEIIEVIKKYIDVDEKDIDVRLTNKTNEDGTTGAPALYANIPIAGIEQDVVASEKKEEIKIDNVPEVIIEEANGNIELDDKEEENGQEEKEVVVESETKPEEAKEIVEEKETKENKEPEKVEEEKKASNVAQKPSTAKKNTAKTSTNKTTKNGKKTTNTNKPKAKKSK